ncbi:MAG: YraN family protein, partial [Thermoguttaceae bacterium]
EKIAAAYLKKKKYKVLGTNVALMQGELDIIAKEDDCVVFVEVRTRKNDKNGQPYELSQKKRRKVASLGKTYIKIHDLYDEMYRFDIISILLPDDSADPQITHIENAFDDNGNLM